MVTRVPPGQGTCDEPSKRELGKEKVLFLLEISLFYLHLKKIQLWGSGEPQKETYGVP